MNYSVVMGFENYCPHRILVHFPALKIVKQNEEMKQNAVV